MRPVGNALELKLCKIPTIGTQSENQTLPTGNISLGNPIVFSGWVLHEMTLNVLIDTILKPVKPSSKRNTTM
ncbi:hypothetical protein EXS84_07190 [Helicobacter pylori]|nr:hypothetical protein [Helicobacter pylori]